MNTKTNPTAEPTNAPQQLIDRYFDVMAKHYAAVYGLAVSPPEAVRHDAVTRFQESSAMTPRRAVDAILAALEAWRAGEESPQARAA